MGEASSEIGTTKAAQSALDLHAAEPLASSGSQGSVSVVIPCYRYGHFLREAVASALDEQPEVDVRVLVIDDASPDDSADVARDIAARDPRVEVLVHARNQGHIATYNEGVLEWAEGTYCVLLSADDRLTPGALGRARDLLDAHPDAGFAYGLAVRFQEGEPPPPARTTVRGWSVRPGEWWLKHRFREGRGGITCPEVAVRTTLQKQAGGYDSRLPHVGDMEMWMRLAAHAKVGFIRGVDQAYYRSHKSNMNSSYTSLMDLRQRRLACDLVVQTQADRLSEPERLRETARRRLSREALWLAQQGLDMGQATEVQIQEFVDFALESWPEAPKLAAFRAVQLRRALGPGVMAHIGPCMPSSALRRGERAWRLRRWRALGY